MYGVELGTDVRRCVLQASDWGGKEGNPLNETRIKQMPLLAFASNNCFLTIIQAGTHCSQDMHSGRGTWSNHSFKADPSGEEQSIDDKA